MGTTRKRKSTRAHVARDVDRRSVSVDRLSVRPQSLKAMRARLVVAAGAARICAAALAGQAADFDQDAALLLRHCICGSVGEGIQVLDEILTGGAS
jgi:hypothetical protein